MSATTKHQNTEKDRLIDILLSKVPEGDILSFPKRIPIHGGLEVEAVSGLPANPAGNRKCYVTFTDGPARSAGTSIPLASLRTPEIKRILDAIETPKTTSP